MSGWILYSSPWALAEDTEQSFLHGAGRPLTAKQLLTSNNVSPPVAAEALYGALDDLMARAGALTSERRWEISICLLLGLCSLQHSQRERLVWLQSCNTAMTGPR